MPKVAPLLFTPNYRYKPWGIPRHVQSEVFRTEVMDFLGEVFLIGTYAGKVGSGSEEVSAPHLQSGEAAGGIIREWGSGYLGKPFSQRLWVRSDNPLLYHGKPEAWYVWKVKGNVEMVHGFDPAVRPSDIEGMIRDDFFVHGTHENEYSFYHRIRQVFRTTKLQEGQAFYNQPGKIHTMMSLDGDSHAIILETQKGYGEGSLTMTTKFLCVGTYGLSVQVHPSTEQVRDVITHDGKLKGLFMNDPTLRLCDLVRSNRQTHAGDFLQYVDLSANDGALTPFEERGDGWQRRELLFNHNFSVNVIDIDTGATFPYKSDHHCYVHGVLLDGEALLRYNGSTQLHGVITSFSIPAALSDKIVLEGTKKATIAFFEENPN